MSAAGEGFGGCDRASPALVAGGGVRKRPAQVAWRAALTVLLFSHLFKPPPAVNPGQPKWIVPKYHLGGCVNDQRLLVVGRGPAGKAPTYLVLSNVRTESQKVIVVLISGFQAHTNLQAAPSSVEIMNQIAAETEVFQ